MARLRDVVASGSLAPATLIMVAKGVAWHARYDRGTLRKRAEEILRAFPSDLNFRLRAALVEGGQRALPGQAEHDEWSPENPWLEAVVGELKRERGTIAGALHAIEAAMGEFSAAGLSAGGAGRVLNKFVEGDLAAASAILELGTGEGSFWRQFVYGAVREILERDPARGRDIVGRALAGKGADREFARNAVAALGATRRALEEDDLALLRRAITDRDDGVVIAALSTLQWDRSLADGIAFKLAMAAPLERGGGILTTFAHVLEARQRKLFELMTDRDAEIMLEKLHHLRELPAGHWCEELFQHLSLHHAMRFAAFLLARADEALSTDGERVELLGYAYHGGRLGFDRSPEATPALALAWDWLRGCRDDEGWGLHRTVGVLEAMFDVDSRIVVEFADLRIDDAPPNELQLIGLLFRHSHHDFAFKNQAFVERLLERVARADPEALDDIRSSFYAAAVSGAKSGLRGEPAPRDLATKAEAERVLLELSRLSPAFQLYDAIRKDAERDIARSIREGGLLDDME